MFDDITKWRLIDPFEGIPLDRISRLSDRARSLLIRNRDKEILRTGFINISGAIDMMAGLDYHADNFTKICAAFANGAYPDDTILFHEAVAYINRAGQFHAFAKSELVCGTIGDSVSLIPTISRIMIFRNKHTAHRSIDAPRNEKSIEEHWRHAQSLGTVGGRLFTPRPGKSYLVTPETVSDLRTHLQLLWEANYLTINTYDPDTKQQINFCLEGEHPTVIGEAYTVVEQLLNKREGSTGS